MNTLLQDQNYRAELNRKRQIYKNMLDQQVRYKNQQRTQQQYQPPQIRISSQPNQYKYPAYQSPITKSYAVDSMPRNYQNSYTPSNRASNNQYQTQKDTEKYLNNCQQIIKNLRDLKQKRKKKQLAPLKIDSSFPSPRNQIGQSPIKNRPEFNYYPKNNYFSNYLWRKDPLRQQSKVRNKRQSSKQLKTLQDQSSLHPQNPEKIRKSLKMPSKYKLPTKTDRSFKNKPYNEDEKSQALDSQQPLGIKVKYSPKNQSKRKSKSPKQKSLSSSKSKERKKKSKNSISNNLQNQQQQNLKIDPQNQIQRQQLYDCLTELKKYLKLKSQQMDKINKIQKVNQEIQVDVVDEQRQANQKKSHINQLKLKALIKLRKLNEKSKQFLLKMGGGDKKDRREYEKRNRKEPRSQLSQLLQKSIKKQQVNDQKPRSLANQQQNQSNLKQNNNHVFPSLQSIDRGNYDSKQNEELLLAINQQLSRQQHQNQELTNCLRELSQYLKNQNQQIQNIKNSRIQDLQTLKKTQQRNKSKNKSKSNSRNNNYSSPAPEYRFQQFPKAKGSFTTDTKKSLPAPIKKIHTPQEDNLLKQAFLKRLKKARLRGKLLNQKIETYKKIHSQKIQQNNPPQNENNPPIQNNQSNAIPTTIPAQQSNVQNQYISP